MNQSTLDTNIATTELNLLRFAGALNDALESAGSPVRFTPGEVKDLQTGQLVELATGLGLTLARAGDLLPLGGTMSSCLSGLVSVRRRALGRGDRLEAGLVDGVCGVLNALFTDYFDRFGYDLHIGICDNEGMHSFSEGGGGDIPMKTEPVPGGAQEKAGGPPEIYTENTGSPAF